MLHRGYNSCGIQESQCFALFKSVIIEGFCKTFDIVDDQAQVVMINWM